MKFKILDLFCGAGGFSYGFSRNKKFEIILANDINKNALETYKKNHMNSQIISGDITKKKIKDEIVKMAKQKKINMVIGGPPCQGFSLKGKREGLNDPRNFLFKEFVEIVRRIKPEVFVMENVKAMFSAANGFFINKSKEMFLEIGYKINAEILNAAKFGAPQNRERAFIIGSITKNIKLPKGSNQKKVTIKEAIGDLSYLNSGEESNGKYINLPTSQYQKKMRKDCKYLSNHKATNHSQHAIKKMSLIPIKGNKFDLPKTMRTKQKFNNTWSRLHWEKLSPTIDTRFDTPSNGQNIHPTLNRAITPREAARIQSFPDRFIFKGNKTSICKQIGNAVPPLIGEKIATQIANQYKSLELKKIGNANLFLGNSLKFDFDKIEEIDAIITDPPYNISKKNNFATMNGKRNGIDFGKWDKNFDIKNWIRIYYSKLKEGGSIIIFGSFLHISYISTELNDLGAQVKDLIKWIKSNPMPRNINRRYVQDSEFAIWAVKPGKWTFNKGRSKYRRAQYKTSTVLGKERTIHPTQKSIKLMEEIIKTHTNKNDLIIDPFMGSGTTGVAAISLDRKFIGIENKKSYFNISCDRLKLVSNKTEY